MNAVVVPCNNWNAVVEQIRKRTRVRVICGIRTPEAREARDDFFYCDHSYLKHGWRNGTFRLVRRGTHLTRVIHNSSDRLKTFGVELRPWKKDGRHVVVIAPSEHSARYFGLEGEAERLAAEAKRCTERDVVIRRKDHMGFWQALEGAWACICVRSIGGVEAAIAGIPVFSTPLCPSWPISAGSIKDIDRPTYCDRYDWANSLAWSSWRFGEIQSINYETYQCV
jgi:hypothetical protein